MHDSDTQASPADSAFEAQVSGVLPSTAPRCESLDIPNPDDPPPAAPFNEKFKLMFAEDSTATWEEFSSILDEFISFSRDHVNILMEPIADPVFRQEKAKAKIYSGPLSSQQTSHGTKSHW